LTKRLLPLKAYEKAIEINPDYHTAYNAMGITYVELRKHKKAIKAFKDAIKINPVLIDLKIVSILNIIFVALLVLSCMLNF
jgi:tetratricopeptide (TPR) repeat protein